VIDAEIDPAVVRALRRQLLPWFRKNHRSLPWRETRDPYRIWVSEVMLQQTTVAAVVPYFQRFIAEFPTVSALASASESDVLKLWQGLGYYRRARHLHAAAQQLAARFGDDLPNDAEVWEELPGVGRYIRGAVLSQAFDRREPIVEANTLRVLSRLFAYRGDPRSGAGQRWCWHAAEAILPRKHCGDFNQAMMELGAIVCTPEQPKCETCPVRTACLARRENLTAQIPPKKAARELEAVREVSVVVRDGPRVLLVQIPPGAKRWAMMWEFPRGEAQPGEELHAAAERILKSTTGLRATIGAEVATVRHGVTRFAITLTAIEATKLNSNINLHHYLQSKWLLPAELADHALSTPQRKIAAALQAPGPVRMVPVRPRDRM
jgi:A/G-specific adenine glycosylase